MKHLRPAVAVIVAMLSRPTTALAQADAAAAETLFAEGKRLMDQGKYAEACPKLAESHRLDRATGALLATALCYERAGKLASAWAAYSEAVSRAHREGRADREQIARDRAAELSKKLPTLLILVESADPVRVTRNGIEIGQGVLGTALPVDPGEHVIEVSASGKQTFRASVQIGERAEQTIVRVPPLADATVPQLAPAPGTADTGGTRPKAAGQARFWTPLRVAGAGMAGVGVVGVAIGAVFGVRALWLKSDSDRDCSEADVCGPEAYRDRNSARSSGTVSTVALVSGIGLTGAGVALFVLGTPKTVEGGVALMTSGTAIELRGKF